MGASRAVVFAQDSVDVVKEGMALRCAQIFQPHGVDVNFVWVDSPDSLRVRIYERGKKGRHWHVEQGPLRLSLSRTA